ncbi:MAG: cell division protein FtsZ [Planctomycetota bacterium]|jgi:cell division protein FtsZ|uniref:cell division protein FtsZ n=1 Tax=Patiriisocius sp. Uisw_047 TaxID=3230969 RepID=UPI0039EA93E7
MSNTAFENIAFDLPKNQSNVIKVIGVGGGGSNAINHMFNQGIKGVDFVICNTDAQALENSAVPIKIQLGMDLTEGMGAGANPKIGEQSAVESMADIKSMLTSNTKMIFITAGMGGGTGTGAAPIIAKMARDLDILTVGIVTIPFQFEGKIRNEQALLGVENLRNNVDSLVVINNNKLREVYGNLGFKAGFSKADEVLATAARGIAEVITHHYTQNIDLRDAKTVLSNSGTAIMGSATATGANRAHEAITKALDSPLLNDNKITGAKNVLLLIVSGQEEITIDEIGEISDHIQVEAGHGANIIMGVGDDESLDGSISITVIATGFDADQQHEITNTESKKIIHTLDAEQKAEQDLTARVTASAVAIPEQTTAEIVKEEEAVKIIRHSLFEEEDTIEVKAPAPVSRPVGIPFEGFIDTSELIRNIDVVSEEVCIHHIAEFDQLVINEIDVNSFEVVTPVAKVVQETISVKTEIRAEKEAITTADDVEFTINEKRQEIEGELTQEGIANDKTITEAEDQMLMFDMPMHAVEEITNVKRHELQREEKEEDILTSVIQEIEVHDHVEIVPVSEVTKEGVKMYSLDDYEEKEAQLFNAKPTEKNSVVEEEIKFETRTIDTPAAPRENAGIDPMNTPISKLLKDRTEERKRKMKDFNYKFRNSTSKLDEIERQPAYKRMGIELEDAKDETTLSRTSVNTEDDGVDLRSNNSFLHDNVD